jgi:Icc-related predicted phosphoesterase
MAWFLNRKANKQAVRLFFATDLHGSEHAFRKFINAAKFYEANVLIMGGDVVGKIITPVIKGRSGRYRATMQGKTEEVETEGALDRLLKRIAAQGAYSKVMSEEEYRAMQAEPSAFDDLFHQLARQRIAEWVDFAETRLKGSGVKCYITGGNDDHPDTLVPLQREDLESVIACEGKEVQVADQYTMISLGFSGPTPWKTPRETDEETLALMLEAMASKVADMSYCIFNLHDPPIDSTLDTCPMLDWNTDPPRQIVRGGQVVMYGAGSSSVRAAIAKYQPLLGLHGHIHESPGAVKLGHTLCINPGSEYGEGILRGALVTLNGNKIAHYQLTSG